MAQRKGQTGNPKGRPKGVPNRVTSDLRSWVEEFLNDNREQVIGDMGKLEPHQRVQMFEKLLSFAIPKMQSVTIEAQIAAEIAAIEKLLNNAPDKAINEITSRILRLNQLNKKENE